MILNSLDKNFTKKYDVIILGTGPAGITTAISLPPSMKVLLVEAGDVDYSEKSQKFYDGKVIGDHYFELDICRLRQFGGSSGHWEGKCRSLDDFDFASKSYAPKAYWPIKKADINEYLVSACQILKIKPDFDSKPYLWDMDIENLSFDFSSVRFRAQYLDDISSSEHIDLITNTAMTALRIDGDSIKEVILTNLSGEKSILKSKYYVFAMGGIENGRMLKFVAVDNPGSALSKNRNVGAYWMEHPHYAVGDYFYNLPDHDQWHVGISNQKKRDLSVLNSNFNFTSQLQPSTDGRVKKLLRDLLCVDEKVGSEVSYGLGKNYCGGRIDASWEQEPKFENRIDLDTQVDAFGIPKTILNWKKSDLDLRTIRLSAEYIAESMVKNKQAKVRLKEWLWTGEYPTKDDLIGGAHHMGGTRMSSSKLDGVVDANLRTWDVSNLYIAGSSVFPSSGHANPTLTIVQLALRLANHLTTKV
jgi:hypothetical protein